MLKRKKTKKGDKKEKKKNGKRKKKSIRGRIRTYLILKVGKDISPHLYGTRGEII